MFQQSNKETLLEAWKALKAGTIYIVEHKTTMLPLLEPNVSIEEESVEMEVLIRLFMSRAEAQRYKEIMNSCGLADLDQTRVMPVDIEEIFHMRDQIGALAKTDYDCKYRVDICAIHDN